MWLTPDVPNGGRALKPGTSVTGKRPDGTKAQVGLNNQAVQWGTPRASDAEKGWPNQSFGAGGIPLPASRDHNGSSEGSITRADGKSRMDMLDFRAEQGFSHQAPETVTHGPKLSQLRPIWRPLRASVIASHGRAAWRRLWRSRNKRRLNPLFVEWLMGWPSCHALCACSATEFTRWQRQMRGALSVMPMASGQWIWKPSVDGKPQIQEEMDI